MADQDQGSKTELPTSKRLRDAREKGDVAKAPDVSITIGFLFALLLFWLVFDSMVTSVTHLMETALASPGKPFSTALLALGQESIRVFINVSLIILIPLALFGTVVEFLVIGPVITAEKFKPKMSNLDPAEGLKRMFGPDNLVELIKSILKTAVLCTIGVMTVRSVLGDLMLLTKAAPEELLSGIWYLVLRVLGWASAAYLLLMFIDIGYQRYSFTKRMKMSIRDIRDEMKDTEGDPMLRGARRDLGSEWATEAPAEAVRGATVLVVNPIHVAIAINYDKESAPLPMITAKGEERVAREMRDIAAAAGVPILRNEQLARALLTHSSNLQDAEDNCVPRELFTIVAEVIIWAHTARIRMEQLSNSSATPTNTVVPPGEDLTIYRSAPPSLERRAARS